MTPVRVGACRDGPPGTLTGEVRIVKRVAVASTLTPVRRVLEQRGFRVVDLEGHLDDADAIVVSGVDEDVGGIRTVKTRMPVIDAAGRAAEDIAREVAERLQRLERVER